MCMPYSHIKIKCFKVLISRLRKRTHIFNITLSMDAKDIYLSINGMLHEFGINPRPMMDNLIVHCY